jgi:hypothetical protein
LNELIVYCVDKCRHQGVATLIWQTCVMLYSHAWKHIKNLGSPFSTIVQPSIMDCSLFVGFVPNLQVVGIVFEQV